MYIVLSGSVKIQRQETTEHTPDPLDIIDEDLECILDQNDS